MDPRVREDDNDDRLIQQPLKEQIISVLGDQILTQNKVHHTMRQDFGTDIQAACGQLAANYKTN